MSKASQTDDMMKSGGFWLHKIVGKYLKVGSFLSQSLIIAGLSAGMMLLASIADHSLYFPGRDVGFLEHPAVWGFLALQTVLPISLARSLRKLEHTTLDDGEIAHRPGTSSKLILPSVREFLKLRGTQSRAVATILYSIGVVAWGLNSIQNQFPNIIVPYDFWDSTTYIFGYIITRFYKAYLFIMLLPYLALVHTAILVATLRVVRNSRISGKLRLLPFHPDRAGGLGFVAGFISKPIILTLIVGAVTTAGAFFIHRAANITPLVGLSILLSWAVLTYLIPILFLRTDIVAMKREMTKKIRHAQQVSYSTVLEGSRLEFRVLEEENEALEYFDRVCGRIESISSFPHWKRLFGFMGLAVTPSLVMLCLKTLMSFVPTMSRLLAQP